MTPYILIGRAADRMAYLAHPPKGEPSPFDAGADPLTWAAAAGLDQEPHDLLASKPLQTAPNDVERIARRALARLVAANVMERCASGWRPVRRRSLRR